MTESVLFDVSEDGIATVTINRPAAKNALDMATASGLIDCWNEIEGSEAIRVAILTSADCGVFCAGMDLKEAARVKAEQGIDILQVFPEPQNDTLRAMKKPVIAAMTGSLMAGGMMLSLNCDLRIGLAGSKAGITEVKVGRGSPWAAPALYMLPQPILMEIVLTGELMPIEKLHHYGFTNYVEETPDAVRARAHQLASSIIAGAPLSVKAAKGSVHATMNLGRAEGLKAAWELHKEVYASEDAVEGPKAFSEKRKPEWRGR